MEVPLTLMPYRSRNAVPVQTDATDRPRPERQLELNGDRLAPDQLVLREIVIHRADEATRLDGSRAAAKT